MNQPVTYTGLACNLDRQLLLSSLPLFAAEKVDAIEWSFDTLFQVSEVPDWFNDLLLAYSNEGRLVGHGVFFSIFSGKWKPEQQRWLDHLKKICSQFKFDHISEHFGFMTGEDFHKGAPLSIPMNHSTLQLGIDRLKRIQDACHCPVGLENLAFSYALEDVKKQGDFLNSLIEPINGFIILDLHNFYCQLQNFDVGADELLKYYPLDRVREIHISGGSWETSETQPIRDMRRDTHDNKTPQDVFDLLKFVLPKCPYLKFVFLEQMGFSLQSKESQADFQHDFDQTKKIVTEVQRSKPANSQNFLPDTFLKPSPQIAENTSLFEQQRELTHLLEDAISLNHLQTQLHQSSLAKSDWNIENWSPYMLETAMKIAQKWKRGW